MIYKPAEDSYFLSDILKREVPNLLKMNSEIKILEMGVGSGIHLHTLENLGVKKENIFSCDIDKDAVKHCHLLGFNCIMSDLFENIKGKYNLIIFNPPYLPEDLREPKDSRVATTGGKKGDEIILKFLNQVKDYLKDNGKIFLLISNLTPKIKFEELGYEVKLLEREKLFYEELSILELVV